METDILIVGAGLSGLALARMLEAEGQSYLLVEARDRTGGRISTVEVAGARFDMGPAWFWPGQPRMAALVQELGLERFDQYFEGDLSYEDESGQVQRGRGYASMQGSYRLRGGLTSMTDALAARLPEHRLRLNNQLTRLTDTGDKIGAQFATGDAVSAKRVVLALPPRIAAEITMVPPLPDTALTAMSSCATWMAGQAKAVAVYETAFWRQEGYSGDAMSRHGPMVEIHDASPRDGGAFALFGFIGIPSVHRRDTAQLNDAVLAQLGRIFGPKAANPIALHIKDWAFDPNTATIADQQPPMAHPHYGLPPAMKGLWNDRLILSGTETGHRFGGYLEGALEAAEISLSRLKES